MTLSARAANYWPMDQLENLLSFLDKIQGLPAVGLVLLVCIIICFVIERIPKIDNSAIPAVAVLAGAVLMLFLADPRPTTMSPRVWTARNLCVGLVIGAAAWLLHSYAWKYIQSKLSVRFGGPPPPEKELAEPQPKPEDAQKP